MPYWNKKKKEFDKMNLLIKLNPGIHSSELAREMGVCRSTITRRLPSMEEAGYLYSEDEGGGLWFFVRVKNTPPVA